MVECIKSDFCYISTKELRDVNADKKDEILNDKENKNKWEENACRTKDIFLAKVTEENTDEMTDEVVHDLVRMANAQGTKGLILL